MAARRASAAHPDSRSSLSFEPPPPRVYERVRAEIERSAPLSAASARVPAALASIPGLCAAPALLFVRTYSNLSAPLAKTLLRVVWPSACLALLVALVATWLARSRGWGLGPSVHVLKRVTFLVLPLALLPLLHRRWQLAMELPNAAELYAREPHCFPIASAVIALSLFWLGHDCRHSVPAGAGWRAAALGAAAGAWTALALLLYCPDVDVVHLLIKHIVPVCLAPLAGWLALRRYVSV